MNSVPRSAFRNPIHFLAIGLGSGAAPRAPGTFGTAAAVLLYIPLAQLHPWWYLAMLLTTALVGIYLCDKTSRDWGVHDHGAIVWDEFVGMWITLFLIPPVWYWVLLGFLLFRFFLPASSRQMKTNSAAQPKGDCLMPLLAAISLSSSRAQVIFF